MISSGSKPLKRACERLDLRQPRASGGDRVDGLDEFGEQHP